MTKNEKIRFDKHYQQLLKCLKLHDKAEKTIGAYSRAVRRVAKHFDCMPEHLTPDNLKDYFLALVESHSWSTVKIDRLGLQFYRRHILKKDLPSVFLLGHIINFCHNKKNSFHILKKHKITSNRPDLYF